MTAVSTKGTVISISDGDIAPTNLTVTAVVPATTPDGPTLITAANTAAAGDVVVFGSSTGFKALNNRAYPVIATGLSATQFNIVGADTYGSTETMSNSITAQLYKKVNNVNLCLSGFDIAAATTNEVDTSTYCADSSVLGKSTPGSITLTGYGDKQDVGMKELLRAESDGIPRLLTITLPGNLGWLIGVISIGTLTWTVPLEGAVGYSANASQNSVIKFVLAP
jgi:hypothetical protein